MKLIGSSFLVAVAALILQAQANPSFGATIKTKQLAGSFPMASWQEIKYEGIVRQSLDDSCGAASLATMLKFHFGENVTEEDILGRMDSDGKTSFLEMGEVAREYGTRPVGIRLPFSELIKLQMPAIAYLKYRGSDHFSVVRGVDPSGNVLLADPMWGNRKFTGKQFRHMWEASVNNKMKMGKLLLIMPSLSSENQSHFFTKDVNFKSLMRFGLFDTHLLD